MPKIRIMVVDDAVVARRVVSAALAADPGLEVVATAPNGRIALEKIPRFNPDLVTLDVEMPELDGLQTLAELRARHPRLPVVMLSRFTRRCAAATLDALALGAKDYLTLPEGANIESARAQIRDELIPKIKLLARPPEPRAAAGGLDTWRPAAPVPQRLRRVEVLVIGSSTGGPEALARVVPALPASLPVPVVIVQHMPPVFTQLLAERLAKRSPLLVREAADGEALRAGQVWLAPGDRHLEVVNEGGAVRLRTHQGPPENSCRPAVDVLLRSAATAYGAGTLAVILTGMGKDGLRGCERVREAGGQVLAQDEATSVVWGMPRFVAEAGLADRVLPLDGIGTEIVFRVSRGRTLSSAGIK